MRQWSGSSVNVSVGRRRRRSRYPAYGLDVVKLVLWRPNWRPGKRVYRDAQEPFSTEIGASEAPRGAPEFDLKKMQVLPAFPALPGLSWGLEPPRFFGPTRPLCLHGVLPPPLSRPILVACGPRRRASPSQSARRKEKILDENWLTIRNTSKAHALENEHRRENKNSS